MRRIALVARRFALVVLLSFSAQAAEPSTLAPTSSALAPAPSALAPASSTLAPAPSTLAPASSTRSPGPSTLSPAPSALPALGYAAATTVTVGAVGLASIAAGIFVHSVPFLINGRPQPYVTAGGFAVMLGLNAGITHLVLPWLATALHPGRSLSDARLTAWQTSRWALLGGAAGVLTYAVGGGLEQASFGRGQAVMLAGAMLSLAAMLVWDVLEAVGSWR